MASLETVWISRANAEQRKGRAGRVMPGLCVRLYTRHRYEYVFHAQPIPEIQRVPLDQIVLSTRTLQSFKSKPIEEVLGKFLVFVRNIVEHCCESRYKVLKEILK